MSAKQPILSDEILEYAWSQVPNRTAPALVEAIATHIMRARNASKRIAEEGDVVRDMKGSVIAHPAIKIEAEATKIYSSMIIKAKNS
jgi:hypothetical protein